MTHALSCCLQSFVRDNNLYMQRTPQSQPARLTSNGRPGVIFAGVPDWLYDGEVLRSNVAHWWSPDNRYICYAELNTSLITPDSYPVYGMDGALYANTVDIRIPKVYGYHGLSMQHTLSKLRAVQTGEKDMANFCT